MRRPAQPHLKPRLGLRRPQGLPWERKGGEPPPGSESWNTPWVQLRYFSNHPHIYPPMIGAVSADAAPGNLVSVYDKEGQHFGAGMFNPRARVPLRILRHGAEPPGEACFENALERALDLRLNLLQLDKQTEAFRVVNSDGDALSGLIVDRYGEVLSVEVHSLGIYQRLDRILRVLHDRLGTRRQIIHVDKRIAGIEGISVDREQPSLRPVRFRENGVRFEVNFETGHKTGFFCDQRDNRLRLSRLVKDRRVLDLCCYTGGFAVTAGSAGGAGEVTGVDLDEEAIEQAQRNGNLNQQRIRWVHSDAFSYARQMQRNGKQWEAIVVDPPKFVSSRDEEAEGRRKYEDLNGLAMSLTAPNGLLVTCSCSGLVRVEDFEQMVIRAAHRQGRRLQFLDRTGAASDHPILSNCLEGRYLKVLWARVL